MSKAKRFWQKQMMYLSYIGDRIFRHSTRMLRSTDPKAADIQEDTHNLYVEVYNLQAYLETIITLLEQRVSANDKAIEMLAMKSIGKLDFAKIKAESWKALEKTFKLKPSLQTKR